MTLPTFVVLGAQRAGTTWLDRRLRAHPAIYLPDRRKEVHFFDWYFDRGVGWYEGFFPPTGEVGRYGAIGEITPAYLFVPEAPGRIRRVLPDARLVAILRDPVDRAYSQYGLSVSDQAEDRDFGAYLEAHPDAVARGRYAEQLARYLERFPRERIFVGVFERMVAEPEAFLAELAAFLGVDPDGFPSGEAAATGRVHASWRPRFPRARAAVRRVGSWLRRRDADWAVDAAKAAGVDRLFGRRDGLPPLDPAVRRTLAPLFADDVGRLEAMLGSDLSRWWGREV